MKKLHKLRRCLVLHIYTCIGTSGVVAGWEGGGRGEGGGREGGGGAGNTSPAAPP